MPMVQQKLGAACKKIAVDYGIEGGAPGSKPGFAAAGHLYCDSVEAFRAAFGPHAKEIMADIPNYTDIPPTIQISEVKVGWAARWHPPPIMVPAVCAGAGPERASANRPRR